MFPVSVKLLRTWFVASSVLLLGAALDPLAHAAPVTVPVDINTATAEELTKVKGVGDATAKKIIANRPYTSLDDLSKTGIPAGTLSKLKPSLTVGAAPAAAAPVKAVATATATAPPSAKPAKPAATASKEIININTATKEQLDSLPGIGDAKAQAIIAGRPYAKIEDIMKVKGIKQGMFDKIKDRITAQ
jgi:competence protein ComEA